jgi:hypothetical protein
MHRGRGKVKFRNLECRKRSIEHGIGATHQRHAIGMRLVPVFVVFVSVPAGALSSVVEQNPLPVVPAVENLALHSSTVFFDKSMGGFAGSKVAVQLQGGWARL